MPLFNSCAVTAISNNGCNRLNVKLCQFYVCLVLDAGKMVPYYYHNYCVLCKMGVHLKLIIYHLSFSR